MRKLYFYNEISEHIGYGHFFRLYSLAQYAADNGFEAVFFEHKVPGFLRNLLLDYHISSIDWNPLKLCNNIIVIDSYIIDNTIIKQLKKNGNIIVRINDFENLEIYPDILVNNNYGAKPEDYPKTCQSKLLLDSKFFFLRKEFIPYRKTHVPKKIEKLLVTLGGSWRDELIHILDCLLEFKNINISVITKDEKVTHIPRFQESDNIDFIDFASNICRLFFKSDLAIIGGGTTKYEAAYTGTPTLAYSLVPHQHMLMERYKESQACIYMGELEKFSCPELSETLKSLIDNPSLLESYVSNSPKVIDKEGANRFYEELREFLS